MTNTKQTHRICEDNLKPLQYSLKQPGRLHTYEGLPVTAIRKVGAHFQLKLNGAWTIVPRTGSVVSREVEGN